MMIKKVLLHSTKHLQDVGIDSAQLDAKVLLKFVTGFSDVDLVLKADQILPEDQIAAYNFLIQRRAYFEPVAYIIGVKEFWGLPFNVTPATLIPRPESELFIEAALERFDKNAPLKILDLGTGTGCLILTLLHEFKNAYGVGVDTSSEALSIASENARALGLQDRIEFIKSNWCDKVEGSFDLIVTNPPYIPEDEKLMKDVKDYEPDRALFGGKSGLSAYESLVPQLKRHTSEKTELFCEIGAGQLSQIGLILEKYNAHVLGVKRDMQAIERLIIACF